MFLFDPTQHVVSTPAPWPQQVRALRGYSRAPWLEHAGNVLSKILRTASNVFVEVLKMQECCRDGLLDPIISAMMFMKHATQIDDSHFVNLQGTCICTVSCSVSKAASISHEPLQCFVTFPMH